MKLVDADMGWFLSNGFSRFDTNWFVRVLTDDCDIEVKLVPLKVWLSIEQANGESKRIPLLIDSTEGLLSLISVLE